MKNLPKTSPSRTGMTLIELTVVILVMLSLIGVLFFGATAWKRGSDRAHTILMIRSAQIGMRSHCQIVGLDPDTSPTFTDLPEQIFGEERYVPNDGKALGELPNHPAPGQSFGYVAGDGDIVPPYSSLYISTGGGGGLSDVTYNPTTERYHGW